MNIDSPERATILGLLNANKPDRYCLLLDLRRAAAHDPDPDTWIRAVSALEEERRISNNVARMLTEAFSSRGLKAPDLQDDTPTISSLRLVGETPEVVSERQRHPGELELLGCVPSDLLGHLLRMRGRPVPAPVFHALVLKHIAALDRGEPDASWLTRVGRSNKALERADSAGAGDPSGDWPLPLPSPLLYPDTREIGVLTRIIEGPKSETYRTMQYLEKAAPEMCDLQRWIDAARTLRDDGAISEDIYRFLVHPFLEPELRRRLDADPALRAAKMAAVARVRTAGAADSKDDDRDSLDPVSDRVLVIRTEHLRSIGEHEWAALMARDYDAWIDREMHTPEAFYGWDKSALVARVNLAGRYAPAAQLHEMLFRYLQAAERGENPDALWTAMIPTLPAAKSIAHRIGL